MTTPMFRVLTKEELAELSAEERVEYRRQLVELMRRQTADTEKVIEQRNNRLQKPE